MPMRMLGRLAKLLKCWIKLFLNEFIDLLETVLGSRPFHSFIGPVSGSRYMAKLRATGG